MGAGAVYYAKYEDPIYRFTQVENTCPDCGKYSEASECDNMVSEKMLKKLKKHNPKYTNAFTFVKITCPYCGAEHYYVKLFDKILDRIDIK